MPPIAQSRAFLVHVFTASGVAFGFAALIAAAAQRWTLMFAALGVALVIDGIDGAIARKARVAERLPRWSGDVLDLVVDFVTYVFVPAYAIATSGLLPQPVAVPAGIVIVMTGALYFSDREMKTPDNYFRGFPALWNAAAFYLFVLKPAPWVAAAAAAILAVLTFMPFKFVHPFRVVRLRALTVAALTLWIGLAAAALAHDLAPGPWVTGGLAVAGLYFLALGPLNQWMSHDRTTQ
ncbi:MAG: CDP-alcohol phosphatidyltransferase family protein [Xanthobacteraceae bacterium]